jgi:hypothetical protein
MMPAFGGSGKVRSMRRRRPPEREIDLSGETSTEGLEVIEEPTAAPAETPPLDLLAGLPSPLEAPYAEPAEDRSGTRGIWTAIEHL